MKFWRILAALAVAMALSTDGFAQSKGNLKITGKVLDAAGNPVADAQVRAAKKGEAQPQVFNAKSNDKGEYSINNVAAGEWVLEASKEGVGVIEVSTTLTDANRTTTLDITIAKATPKPDANAEHQRALQLAQSGKIAEARKVYEDLMKVYPELHQLHAMMGNLYAAEGNAPKALEHLDIALAKEPTNVDWLVLKADVMMENKDQAGAEKILEGIDITQVKEARAFINLAINKINAGKHDEAIALLTKLQTQFPSDLSILYYRGRAYVAATKLPEAKADLEKFVAGSPADSPQVADAKKILEALNKK
jgi:tetratricopeptide (TPR) repeat protein